MGVRNMVNSEGSCYLHVRMIIPSHTHTHTHSRHMEDASYEVGRKLSSDASDSIETGSLSPDGSSVDVLLGDSQPEVELRGYKGYVVSYTHAHTHARTHRHTCSNH